MLLFWCVNILTTLPETQKTAIFRSGKLRPAFLSNKNHIYSPPLVGFFWSFTGWIHKS